MADRQVGPGLYVKLGLDYNGIIGGVGGVSLALNQSLELFSKFEGMAQGFIDLANNAGKMGKEIKDNARDLGLSTDQFQQWTHAAIAAGSSAEEITGSIRMMSVRIGEARDPTSDMSRSLAALGISALDSTGKMRPMNDLLLDIFPALNRLPEGFDRNQAAMTLFGRGFSNVADLAGMTREELQALIDLPPAFSEEKIQQLDAYNTQLQLLNEKMERSSAIAGSELISSFSTWGEMIDTSLQEGQPLMKFFEGLNISLEMVAEGFTLLGARYIAFAELITPASGKFGNMDAFGKTIADADAAVREMRRQFALAETGYFEGAVWDESTGTWKSPKSKSESTYAPAAAQKKAETVAAVVSEGLTYNEMFKSSLGVGGVGPDYAGFSDLASMSQSELEGIAAGGLGKSKAMSEKAQMYLSLMGTSGGAGGATAGKAEAKDEVTIAKDKYTLLRDAYQTHIDAMFELNVKMETDSLTHWTAETELVRISLENLSEAWRKYVTFAAENPTIHNIGIVTWTKQGPDWTPESNPIFMQTAKISALASLDLAYKSADFSSIAFSGQSGEKGGEKEVKIEINQTITGIDTTTTPKVTNATLKAIQKAEAGINGLGGSMI